MTGRIRVPLCRGMVLLLCVAATLSGQRDTLVVMTYNLLNFPDHSASRLDAFAAVLAATGPDILVTNEMLSSAGVNTFAQQVLGRLSPNYQAGPFTAGDFLNNAVFYKRNRVTLETEITIGTALRDINGYVFRISDHADSAFTWTLFTAHLKAGNPVFATDAPDERRWAEARQLQAFIAGQDSTYTYLLAGDLNLYTASEAAFLLLMDSMAVDLEDPLDARVNWHNFRAVAGLHTQSTRTEQLSDGGSSGGMDDRFDFFLLAHHMFADSAALAYVPGSQVAYGNDGQHYNNNINAAPTNGAVGQAMADALYVASDHLPVLLSLSYPVAGEDLAATVSGPGAPLGFRLVQNHPNPFNPTTTLRYDLPWRSTVVLSVYDLRGQEVARLVDAMRPAGQYEVIWGGRTVGGGDAAAGIYFARLRATPTAGTARGFSRSIKMLLLK